MAVNLSLCSGYGGLDMAVERLTGNRTTVYAEKDPAASLVMAARFPEAVNLGDLETIDWLAVAAEYDVDTLSAGFSCQDISNAGPRKGITGERSKVWFNVAEAVRVVRPGVVFLENVSAIRSRGIDVVLGDLAAIGYDARWVCFRASAVGAAHHRDRWFCLAHPAADAPGVGWPERWTEPAEQQGEVRRAPWRGDPPLADADSVGRHRGGWNEPEADRRDEPPDRRYSPSEWWGNYLPAIRRWESLTGSPAPAPTEIGPKGGRRLAARFAEWLMGISSGHVTDVPGLSRSEQLHKIGNGAVPQQSYEAFRFLSVRGEI